ncbi:MAG: hypothetical protein LUE27_02175 [Clostridia bacterium]|nr:hypothetical protein [Clostridia bacterium]
MKLASIVLVDEERYYTLQAVSSPAFNKIRHDSTLAEIMREAARVVGYDGYKIYVNIEESERGILCVCTAPCLNFEDMYRYDVIVATESDNPFEDGKAFLKTMSHEEMLETLSLVCGEDRLPGNLDAWKDITEEFFSDAAEYEETEEMKKAGRFVLDNMHLMPGDEKFPEYWSVMMSTYANTSAYGMNMLIANILDSQKKYEDILSLFRDNPSNPVYADYAGDIMNDGYLGEPDYEKAYEYYRFAAYRGHVLAMYKLAFMYRDGRYVEKDYEECKRLLLQDYYAVTDVSDYYLPTIAEALLELSRAGQASGNTKDALKAVSIIVDGLEHVWAHGATVTETDIKCVEQMYALKPFAKSKRRLADLLLILQKPGKVSFTVQGKKHTAETVERDGEIIVAYEGQYYRDPADFMNRAEIDGKPMRVYANDIKHIHMEDAAS